MTPKEPLHWVIDRFENGYAVLLADQKEWLVPRGQVPEKSKEGDVLSAEFYLQKNEKARKENLAKLLLEEILGK